MGFGRGILVLYYNYVRLYSLMFFFSVREISMRIAECD